MIDFHNHVIPGVDDGAATAEQGADAVAALGAEGVTRVVATPHVDGSLTRHPPALERRLAELDEGLDALREELARRGGEGAGLPSLGRGVELKLDVPEVDLSDPRLRLDGGTAVLVEFPYMTVPPRSAEVLAAIRDAGRIPVLAHPERYHGVRADPGLVDSWVDAGAVLQVNAPAITSRYGDRARRRAIELLERGRAHCMASDFHAVGDPGVADARALLEEWGGEEIARLLLDTNPARLLRGEQCLPVPRLRRRKSLRDRLFRRG